MIRNILYTLENVTCTYNIMLNFNYLNVKWQ